MTGMIQRSLLLLAMLPAVAGAQNFKGYKPKTLDAVVDEWNGRTRNDGPGVSYTQPEKIKFVAALTATPKSCSTGALEVVLMLIDFSELLQQVKVSHCVTLVSLKGRTMSAYVQDVLVPGLSSDVSVGDPVEIYADVLAFQVNADRSRNAPVMLVSRFEPMRH